MCCLSESIETRTRDDDERVLCTSTSSNINTCTKTISIITTEPNNISRRKRKRNNTSRITINSSILSLHVIGMFQQITIMVMIFTLSTSVIKRIPIANGLSVTRATAKTKTTRSGIIPTTTAGTTTLLKTISISPAIISTSSSSSSSSLSSSSALNLALDSRELRFYGAAGGGTIRRSSSSDSSSKDAAADVGTYYNQEWFASATLSATKDQNQTPVLALAGVGLDDNEELNKRINNFNKNKNINDSTSMDSGEQKSNGDDGITNNKNSNGSNKEEDGSTSSHYCYETEQQQQKQQHPPPKRGYGPYINLSPEERELFRLIRKARDESGLSTTMRVAGGWVRDKLLATPEFTRTYGFLDNNDDTDINGFGGEDTTIARNNSGSSSGSSNRSTPKRLTSKYKTSSAQSTSAGRFGAKVIGGGKKNKKNNKNSSSNNSAGAASNAGSMQRFQQHEPVDIDIALDDMLGREFAELLNECLSKMGEKTHGVGVVLKNPEKSKHLETATMKVGTFWIDFVNLRAEEYTQDSRIPDLMRIGTPSEDAFRRDLTINSLFYNVNNGQVEDWTGRGFDDLRRCVVSTPLAPLTTLLDDPLRTLRSVRFAARLRFTMDDSLVEAAMDDRVRKALAEKVSRERIGCEVDLMLRSPDPVGAMRLLINLNLARTVFPIEKLLSSTTTTSISSSKNEDEDDFYEDLFERGLDLLSTNYDQLEECKLFPPVWCNKSYRGSYTTHGTQDTSLSEDDDALRYMWYASFLKPLYDHSLMIDPLGKNLGRKANRSVVCKLLVDELKRPTREAEAVEKIMKGANDFKQLMNGGGDFSAVSILLSDIRVHEHNNDSISSSSEGDGDDISDSSSNAQSGVGSRKMKCSMNGQQVYTATENDPVWDHAMEFRLQCSNIMRKVGPLWRAALFLAMSEHITEALQDDLDYVIEGDIVDESQEELRQREIERYDSVGTAMQRIGLVGVYEQKPLMDGGEVKKVLPNIPKGPIFRDIMDEQEKWMTLHPCARADILARHLAQTFPDYQ